MDYFSQVEYNPLTSPYEGGGGYHSSMQQQMEEAVVAATNYVYYMTYISHYAAFMNQVNNGAWIPPYHI